MNVYVLNDLTRGGAVILENVDTFDAIESRYGLDQRRQHRSKPAGGVRGHLIHRLKMLFGDNEQVTRRQWGDVKKGNKMLVLKYKVRRNLTRRDLAENATGIRRHFAPYWWVFKMMFGNRPAAEPEAGPATARPA